MNITLSLLAAFTVAIMPFAQFNVADSPLNDFYISTAIELGDRMDEDATGEFLDLMVGDEELEARVREYGNACCHEPDRILVMEFDADRILDKGMKEGWYLSPRLTDKERMMLYERYEADSVLMRAMMQMDSATFISATIIRTGQCYFSPVGWGKDAIVLLVKDDADVLIACSYSISGDGILFVSAIYIPAELNGKSTADELTDLTGEAFMKIEIH